MEILIIDSVQYTEKKYIKTFVKTSNMNERIVAYDEYLFYHTIEVRIRNVVETK